MGLLNVSFQVFHQIIYSNVSSTKNCKVKIYVAETIYNGLNFNVQKLKFDILLCTCCLLRRKVYSEKFLFFCLAIKRIGNSGILLF